MASILTKQFPNPLENTVTAAGIVPLGVGPLTPQGDNSFINRDLLFKNLPSGGNGWSDDLNKNLSKVKDALEQGYKEASQPIWERDSTPQEVKDALEQGYKEASQPIWERDSTPQEVKDTITKPFEAAKETIQNVTKGVGDALPIIAIGAGAIVVLGLLLGRR